MHEDVLSVGEGTNERSQLKPKSKPKSIDDGQSPTERPILWSVRTLRQRGDWPVDATSPFADRIIGRVISHHLEGMAMVQVRHVPDQRIFKCVHVWGEVPDWVYTNKPIGVQSFRPRDCIGLITVLTNAPPTKTRARNAVLSQINGKIIAGNDNIPRQLNARSLNDLYLSVLQLLNRHQTMKHYVLGEGRKNGFILRECEL
ncbi:hypothetical protein B0O80DRAFT_425853 [Mortierella sp. GBAus27b]|nr:hypothetical protein B0O80DRAFT_425853 [Mortierella sp. GBAus27b]